MKKYTICVIIFFSVSSQLLLGQMPFSLTQMPNPFPTDYTKDKIYNVEKTEEYKDIDGTPYLCIEFQPGVFYLKDSKKIELPIRYNIYRDEMEYLFNGISYVVGSPETLEKVVFAGSEFRYLPTISKGGYFELFESGKCTFVQKKVVEYKPSEGSKPIVGLLPAKFVRNNDVFYFVINQTKTFKVSSISSVIKALEDQKSQIESYIKQEKIKNIKKENLIKIVKYYNSL
jgi:hypothetical protein